MFSLLALAHRIVLGPSFEDSAHPLHYMSPNVILRLGANARAIAFKPTN